MTRGTTLLLAGLVAVAALSGTVAATPSGDTITDDCSEQDRTTLLYVEGNDTAVTDAVTLYPGTRVHVAYCGDTGNSQTNTWDIASEIGIEDISSTTDVYSGNISGDRETIVLDDETIENKDPDNTITITVQQGPQVQSDLTNSTLLFRNSTAATYRDYEQAYLSAAGELTAGAQTLNDTMSTLGNDDRATIGTLESANETLTNMSEARTATTDNANELRQLLYENVTEVEQAPGSYTRAMGAVDDHEQETNETVINSLRQYNDALDSVEGNARQTILMNLLIGLVPGLLVGGIGGAAVIKRLGESAQFFRDYGGGDYGSKKLYMLVGAGLGLVALGAASMVVTGLWRAII